MIRYRLYLDKDKETEWLNKMAQNGWAMKHFFAGFFSFEPCEKGEYAYQVDFGNKLFSVTEDYREFMLEAGIEIVQTWGFWVILRKRASEGKFELYTDVASSIEYYKKIRKMFKVVTIMEIIILMMDLYAALVMGVTAGYTAAMLIGVIVIIFFNAIASLNNTIGELQERIDGIEYKGKNRNISGLMGAGVMLNGCVILIKEYIPHNVKFCLQIIAFVMVLAGVYQIGRNRRR